MNCVVRHLDNEFSDQSYDTDETVVTTQLYFRKSSTNTCNRKKIPLEMNLLGNRNRSLSLTLPSDALAPTLSPREFQHTSKMPPVPL